MDFSTNFFISIIMLFFVFTGIGIKILLKKNGRFSGTCASQNPLLKQEGESCSLCGAQPDEQCENENS